jgi:hypothetical protein
MKGVMTLKIVAAPGTKTQVLIEKTEVAGGRPEWGAEVGKEYFVIKLED